MIDEKITSLALPAVISIITSLVTGIITGLITISYKLKKQFSIDKEKEYERIRIKYLHPLLVAAQDLLDRMTDIRRRRKNEKEKNKMMQWFRKIKSDSLDKGSFEYWANDEGYFAMSSLYVTAVYFSYASRIRREFPFIELSPGDNKALLSHIADVRLSIGGKFGIWEVVQDSLGSYLIKKDSDLLKSYKEFCESIIDKAEVSWFNRLIDFFADIDKKLEDHLENIQSSLTSLIDFLAKNLEIKMIMFQITEDTIKTINGKKDIREGVALKLEGIKDNIYNSEIEFFDALVVCLGQDDADDFRPSILRYARKWQNNVISTES
jgi:hypothetical protein